MGRMTCIDCGQEFTQERLYKGYYCEDCREAYTREPNPKD